MTSVYDADSNTLFWGTGNPDTGAKKWHFQYTPHDVNDWDSTQTPILAEGMFQGQQRKMVVLANRNGF